MRQMTKQEKALYLLAANKVIEVYKGNSKKDKNTEWNSWISYWDHKQIQVLAIAGTNDLMDWFWNLCLLSKQGVKLGAYKSAQRILRSFERLPGVPLCIACHSRSGPTGIHLQEVLQAEYCIAFCSARGFREKKENKNTTMFQDLDDLVPKLGWSRFHHRQTKKIPLPKDKKWYNIKGKIQDHGMNHIKTFIKEEL